MDHRMPLKNGIEATKEILEINHNAKIIFASADEEIEHKARKLGIASFKKKPFSNQRLVNNIHKAMKKNQNAPINLV
jgi:two-component system chemotaxis response regulator CheY